MNWKRGLFRAWAALSVTWLVLVGVLFGSSVLSPFPELPEAGMIEKSVELARAHSNGFIGFMPIEKETAYEDALKRGLLRSIRLMAGKKDKIEIVLQDQMIITDIPSDMDAKEISRRISNYYQDRRSKELSNRIATMSALLLVPPAVLLVMGIGIYWVAAGFKKSNERVA